MFKNTKGESIEIPGLRTLSGCSGCYVQLRTYLPDGHSGYINSVTYSPNGRVLASGSGDHTIKLWDVETWGVIKTLSGHSSYINSVTYSPDGRVLASGSGDTTIKLWDAETWGVIKTLSGHSDYVASVAYSPDGRVLASGSGDTTIKLWNTETYELIKTLSGHRGNVDSVVYSPDGKVLASGSWGDCTIKLWNTETYELIKTLSGHSSCVTSVVYSPDGKMLASGSWDNTIKLWNAETYELIKTLIGHISRVNSVVYSPDGKVLASGSMDNTIKLWDVVEMRLLGTLSGHRGNAQSVVYSPNSQILASGLFNCTITLWDVRALISEETKAALPKAVITAAPPVPPTLSPSATAASAAESLQSHTMAIICKEKSTATSLMRQLDLQQSWFDSMRNYNKFQLTVDNTSLTLWILAGNAAPDDTKNGFEDIDTIILLVDVPVQPVEILDPLEAQERINPHGRHRYTKPWIFQTQADFFRQRPYKPYQNFELYQNLTRVKNSVKFYLIATMSATTKAEPDEYWKLAKQLNCHRYDYLREGNAGIKDWLKLTPLKVIHGSPALFIKMLLVGNSAVGKTSIVFRYSDDAFNTTFISTVGADFKIKRIMHTSLLLGEIKQHIIDAGGREHGREWIMPYFNASAVIFMVYDCSNIQSFEDIVNWNLIVKKTCGINTIRILVANKIDDVAHRVISFEDGVARAKELNCDAYWECSAKADEGVEELFHMATDLYYRKIIAKEPNVPFIERRPIVSGRSPTPPQFSSSVVSPIFTTSPVLVKKAPFIISLSSSANASASTTKTINTQKVYDYKFTILLVGDSGVGKSMLLARYADDHYESRHYPSVSIDFKIKTIEHPQLEKTKLQIWDTPGMERVRHMTTTHWRGAPIVMMFYDCTNLNSFDSIKCDFHKLVIEHCSREIIIILVANKIDQVHKPNRWGEPNSREISSEVGIAMAIQLNCDAYWECSAKTGEGVEELFQMATDLYYRKIVAKELKVPFIERRSKIPWPPATAQALKNNAIIAALERDKIEHMAIVSVVALAGAMLRLKNNTLTTLDLSNQKIDDRDAALLLTALQNNYSVKNFKLQGNPINAHHLHAIERLLERNRTLHQDFFNACQKNDVTKVQWFLQTYPDLKTYKNSAEQTPWELAKGYYQWDIMFLLNESVTITVLRDQLPGLIDEVQELLETVFPALFSALRTLDEKKFYDELKGYFAYHIKQLAFYPWVELKKLYDNLQKYKHDLQQHQYTALSPTPEIQSTTILKNSSSDYVGIRQEQIIVEQNLAEKILQLTAQQIQVGVNVTQLQHEVTELKSRQAVLVKAHDDLQNEFNRSQLKEQSLEALQQKFPGRDDLVIYYRTIACKLEELFLAYKVLASELVPSTIQFTQASDLKSMLHAGMTLLGHVIPLIGDIGDAVYQVKMERIAKQISTLGTLRSFQEAAVMVAFELTNKFHRQIKLLAQSAIEPFAEMAVVRIMQTLQAGIITNQQLLVPQLLAAVTAAPKWLEQIVTKVKFVMKTKALQKIDGTAWLALEVYTQSGLVTEQGQQYEREKARFPEASPHYWHTNTIRYGYAGGTVVEANARGFEYVGTEFIASQRPPSPISLPGVMHTATPEIDLEGMVRFYINQLPTDDADSEALARKLRALTERVHYQEQELQTEIRVRENQYQNIEQQLHLLDRRYEQRFEKNEAQLKALRKQLMESLKQQLEENKKQLSRLRELIKSSALSNKQEYESNEQQLKLLSEQQTELIKSLDQRYQQQFEKNEKQLNRLREQQVKMVKSLDRRYEKEFQDIHMKLRILDNEQSRLLEQRQQDRAKIKKNEQSIIILRDELENLQNPESSIDTNIFRQLEALTEANESLKVQERETSEKIKELEDQDSAMWLQIKKLATEARFQKLTDEDLQEQIEECMAKIRDLKCETQILSQQQNELQEENEWLQTQEASMAQQLRNVLTSQDEPLSQITACENRIQFLEDDTQALRDQYHREQALLKKQIYIDSQTELRIFARTLRMQLSALFLVYRTLYTGKLVRVGNQADTANSFIQTAANSLPIGGGIVAWVANFTIGYFNSREETTKRVSILACDTQTFEKSVEFVARELTRRYEDQIMHLTSEGASALAESAVKYITHYIKAGHAQEIEQTAATLSTSGLSFEDHMIKAVTGIKLKLGTMFFGVVHGVKHKPIATKKKSEEWTDEGIFQRCGVKIQISGKIHYYKHPNTSEQALYSRPTKYGFSWGVPAEIEALLTLHELEEVNPLLSPIDEYPLSELHSDVLQEPSICSPAPMFHQNIAVQTETYIDPEIMQLKTELRILHQRLEAMTALPSTVKKMEEDLKTKLKIQEQQLMQRIENRAIELKKAMDHDLEQYEKRRFIVSTSSSSSGSSSESKSKTKK